MSNKKNICDYYNSPFILYCRNHDRVCHRNCNGEKLCLHFDKNDSSNCEVCNWTKSSHRYIMNYKEQKEKEYNSNYLSELILIDEEYLKLKNKGYHYLMVCIETLKKLIIKNKDLNEITLLKEDPNYKNGYIQKVLNEIRVFICY